MNDMQLSHTATVLPIGNAELQHVFNQSTRSLSRGLGGKLLPAGGARFLPVPPPDGECQPMLRPRNTGENTLLPKLVSELQYLLRSRS